jgi:hypothetical protein
MERFAGHFITLLQGIVKDPGVRISDLEMLTEEERHRLMNREQEEVNQTGSLMLNADFDF